jgi:hypothetical protein
MEQRRNAGNVLSINLPLGEGKLPCIGSEDIGKRVLALFKKGPEMTGRTVGVTGDHLTGQERFPGAQELANQAAPGVRRGGEPVAAYIRRRRLERTGLAGAARLRRVGEGRNPGEN